MIITWTEYDNLYAKNDPIGFTCKFRCGKYTFVYKEVYEGTYGLRIIREEDIELKSKWFPCETRIEAEEMVRDFISSKKELDKDVAKITLTITIEPDELAEDDDSSIALSVHAPDGSVCRTFHDTAGKALDTYLDWPGVFEDIDWLKKTYQKKVKEN